MSEWIAAALALALPLMTLAGALCYRAGLRAGLAAGQGARGGQDAQKMHPPAPAAGAARAPQDGEEARLARILANIDAYDGTDAHQVDP